jgi:hypothetical protein
VKHFRSAVTEWKRASEDKLVAIPSRDKTFGLENCRDLLRKLEWELSCLRDTTGDDPEPLMFFAFNAAVTAWHLGDWVWSDMTDVQRNDLQVEWEIDDMTKGNFRFEVRNKNRSLALCREVATASKHVEILQSPDPLVRTEVSAEIVNVLSNGMRVVDNDGSQVIAEIGWKLLVKDKERSIPFIEVVEGAVDFWTEFIHHKRIAG